MEVLFIVLNDLSYMGDILKVFVEEKVRGATILESEGMAKAVLKNEGLGMLLTGPFASSLPKSIGESKTLFTVIPDAETVTRVVNAIQHLLSTSKKDTIGFMFTLPVTGIYPLKKRNK